MTATGRPPIVNINIGVLGHIDSGKTSICRALSTHLSTSALDKAPESKRRGITLELGFSAFYVNIKDVPPTAPIHQQLQSQSNTINKLQFTLIDCPGHASLLRTILSGTSIMDGMFLVVDAVAGIQTQTAECLVLSELMTQQMIVIINKIDLLYTTTTSPKLRYEKLVKQIRSALGATKWKDYNVPIVGVCSNGSVEHDMSEIETLHISNSNKRNGADITPNSKIQPLIDTLLQTIKLPQRDTPLNSNTSKPEHSTKSSFLFLVDHCFPIKGSGTVLTGTVLSGSISVGDSIELPAVQSATSSAGIGLQRKIKSMQMFKQPVQQLIAGDRAGICVTQLDTKESTFTHGIVCQPGSVQTYYSIVASLEKIKFYRSAIKSKQQYHITIANTTTMAQILLFQRSTTESTQTNGSTASANPVFDITAEYTAVDELLLSPATTDTTSPQPFPTTYALLRFDSPIQIPTHSLLIGSKLDIDITRTEYASMKTCRIAFSGRMLLGYDVVERKVTAAEGSKSTTGDKHSSTTSTTPLLRLTKYKHRTGTIDRLEDPYTAIVKDMFVKNTDVVQLFMGFGVTYKPYTKGNEVAACNVHNSNNTLTGTIDSLFGQSSKVRIKFSSAFPTHETTDNRGRLQLSLATDVSNKQVQLRYKKHVVLGTRTTNNKNVKQKIEPA